MMTKGFTITEMRERSQATDHHFFDRETLKFFNAKVHTSANDVGLFVASSQFIPSSGEPYQRRFDVKQFDWATGKTTTVGEGLHKTLADATAERKTLSAELREVVAK